MGVVRGARAVRAPSDRNMFAVKEIDKVSNGTVGIIESREHNKIQ